MKIQTFWIPIFFLCCCIHSQINKLPDLSFYQENGEEKILTNGIAKILYFFDEKDFQKEKNFQIINQIFYGFRNKKLEVFAIYSGVKGKEKIQEIREFFRSSGLLYPFFIDVESKALKNLSISQIPAVVVADEVGNIKHLDTAENISYLFIRQQVRLALQFITKEEATILPPETDIFLSKNFMPETEKNAKFYISLAPANKEPSIVKQLPEKNTVVKKTEQYKGKKIQTWEMSPVFSTKIPVVTSATLRPLTYTDKGNLPSQHFFSFFLIFLLKILPLFIWGWGMFYSLAKLLKYNRMFWAFLACFLFFSLNLLYLIMQIPLSLAILLYPLFIWQQFLLEYYNFLKPFHLDTFLLILGQFGLIAGLSSRYKKEKECLS